MPFLSRDANRHLRKLLIIAIGIVASMQFYFIHGPMNQIHAVNYLGPNVLSEMMKGQSLVTSNRLKGAGTPSIKPSTESVLLSVSTKTASSNTALHNNICQRITLITPSKTQTYKYLIWYPRAGMGNILVSYVSAVLYSCLTGRILKIAPPSSRERDVFDCNEYWDDNNLSSSSSSSTICQDLEMDKELTTKYQQSHIEIKTPEAWDISHCTPQTKSHLQYFLCDDGLSEDEFIAVSSCQYWGDLLYSNPYLKNELPSSAFREVVRSKLSSPSDVIREKMVHGRYEVCIHVRWNLEVRVK